MVGVGVEGVPVNALSDALAVAQARTVQTLSRSFLAAQIDSGALTASLDGIGLTDKIEQAQLIACLEALAEAGASLPSTNGAKPQAESEPASDKQLAFIRDLCDRKGVVAPGDVPLTKEQASEIIDSLNAGTYDPDKWTAPF